MNLLSIFRRSDPAQQFTQAHIQQAVQEQSMSILSSIGHFAKVFFTKVLPVEDTAAIAAGPIVNTFFPGIGTLMEIAATEAGKAEALAAAAGQRNGTGTQKAALVVAALGNELESWAAQNGYQTPTVAELGVINTAVVQILNTLKPAASATAAPAATPAA